MDLSYFRGSSLTGILHDMGPLTAKTAISFFNLPALCHTTDYHCRLTSFLPISADFLITSDRQTLCWCQTNGGHLKVGDLRLLILELESQFRLLEEAGINRKLSFPFYFDSPLPAVVFTLTSALGSFSLHQPHTLLVFLPAFLLCQTAAPTTAASLIITAINKKAMRHDGEHIALDCSGSFVMFFFFFQGKHRNTGRKKKKGFQPGVYSA